MLETESYLLEGPEHESDELPLPRSLSDLERNYGRTNFAYRILWEIRNHYRKKVLPHRYRPPIIKVIVDPSLIPPWFEEGGSLQRELKMWLMRSVQRWADSIEIGRGIETPARIILVELEIGHLQKKEDSLVKGDSLFNVMREVMRVSRDESMADEFLIQVSIPRAPIVHPQGYFLTLITPTNRGEIEQALGNIDGDPFFIGQNPNAIENGNGIGFHLWRRFPLVESLHARLDWDGTQHWLWNISVQEIWLRREGNEWNRVIRDRPLPLFNGNSFLLGRMGRQGVKPYPIVGSALIGYKTATLI